MAQLLKQNLVFNKKVNLGVHKVIQDFQDDGMRTERNVESGFNGQVMNF